MKNTSETIQEIKITINTSDIIDFYGAENTGWASNELNRLDVLEFCELSIPEDSRWNNYPKILSLTENTTYQFSIDFDNGVYYLGPPSTNKVHEHIVFEQILSGDVAPKPWDVFFNLNGILPNGNTLTVPTDSPLTRNVSTDITTLLTSSSLPDDFTLQYTIIFKFSTNNITRYCQIDPIIRSHSKKQ